MYKIIILPNKKLCPLGFFIKSKKRFKNLCDLLLFNFIFISNNCNKLCKCITCKVYFKEGFFYFNKINYKEKHILIINNLKNSFLRLSCQVLLNIYKFFNILLEI